MNPSALDALAITAASGDEVAFTSLVEATEHEVRAFVCARAAHASMVEEVVQATYVTAFSILGRYEARGTLLSWLKGIARNRLSEELRRMQRSETLHADLAEQLVAADCTTGLEANDEQALAAERLRGCLDRLPPRTRQLIELRYWQDLPLTTLAERLGQPATNLAALLYRARKALLGCLEGKPS